MAIDLYSYPACLGTLVIDWANRKFTFTGMDGNGGPEMTVAQVQAALTEHAGNPDVEVMALVFWPENEQLCAHDAAGFEGELERDRDIKNEDMAGPDDTEEQQDDAVIRQLAKDKYASDDVDIDTNAVVSVGDNGAYVAAWVFVDKEDIPGWDEEENPDA